MDIISIFFYLVTSVIIFSAVSLIFVNNTIHAALLLVLIFFNSAILWLLLKAEFLSIVLVLVYVGAVLVLFLFVIMLLDAPVKKNISQKIYLLFSVTVSIIMFVELFIVIFYSNFSNIENISTYSGVNNTYEIGVSLFTEHVLSFEITAFILLVAIIAAIAINTTGKKKALRQNPSKQVLANKDSRLKIIKDEYL
jgi:NADH-quinone oxidoreductase subunit J